MKFLVSVPLLSLLAACPAPIESVDGLAGGTLTSKLSAPAVETTDATAASLSVTNEMTAGSVTAGAVTSAGALTGSSVVVQRGAARVAFFGLIVGTTPHSGASEQGPDADGTNPNYSLRQTACATAFPATDELPAAHVCTVQEAMAHALQSPDTVPTAAEGAMVHTYGHYWFAAPDADGVEQLVSDCGGMIGASGSTSSSVRLHKRASDGVWSLRIENTCLNDDPLLCCQ